MTDQDILSMKQKLMSGIRLQFAAKPVMAKLAEVLDEAICLAVPSSDQMLVVDMVPSSRPGELSSFVGQRCPQNQSAECEGFVDEMVADIKPSDSGGENHPGVQQMIKVPLWNGQQRVCGWLCLSGLVERLMPKRLRELLPILKEEGESLSVSLARDRYNSIDGLSGDISRRKRINRWT